MNKKRTTKHTPFLERIHQERRSRVQRYKRYAKESKKPFDVKGYYNWSISQNS